MKRPQNFDELLNIAKNRPDVHGALSQLGISLKRVGHSMGGVRWQTETKSGTSGDLSAIAFIEKSDGSWIIFDNKGRIGQQSMDAITCLREIFGVSFDDAVYMLSGGAPSAPVAKPQKLTLEPKAEPREERTYTPPTPTPDKLRHVKAYLIQTRKLPKELVLTLIDSGKISATERFKSKTAFCTFPITDENGNNVGTDMAATIDDLPKEYKKHLEKGSNADYAWCFPYEVEEITAETPIFFCEAPIDTMSLCALSGTPGIYVSMAGCKDRTFTSVAEKLGGTPIICVDNDETGDAFAARHPDVTRMVAPYGKDWNDTLKYYVENNLSYAYSAPDAEAAPNVPLEDNVAHVHYEREDVDPKKENGALDKGASEEILKQEKYQEYQSFEENKEILQMVANVKNKTFAPNDKVYLGTVDSETAKKIHSLTGVNVENFKMAIEARQVEHILKDHGESGKSDRSMANASDVARLEFTLKNYDSLINAGKSRAYTHMINGRNKTADTVLYEKDIGEKSYYIVQAVPDTKSKTLYIVSSFIGKQGYKKEVSQLIDENFPNATSETGSATPSVNIIPPTDEKINTSDEKNSNPLYDKDPPIADNVGKQSQDELRATLEAKVADVVNNYRADPRALAEYVIFSSRFNNYSANNLRLIWSQYPYAQYVTSAYDFSHGLPDKNGKPTISEKIFIKKGEHALRIWKPYDVKYTVMPDGTEKRSAWLTKSEREQAKAEKWKELKRTFFTLVPVFDITQTTASPDVYPKLCGLGGIKGTSADARFNALKNYCENVLNCPIIIRDFGERKATVRGSFYPDLNEIHISDMLEGENKLSTFIHELGHATLHADSYKNASKSTAQIELEADMYALMIERRLGIEPTDARCRHLKAHYDEYIAEIKSNDINADTELFNNVIDRYREQIPLIDAYVDNLNVAEAQTVAHQDEQAQRKGGKSMYNKSFVEACLNADATLFDLDDYIEYWHTHETGNTLQEFLGLTDYEYEQWGKSSDIIFRDIIRCRQEGIEFSEYKLFPNVKLK